MGELQGKSVLVLGLGVSGRSAARFCATRGARVVAADERDGEALGDLQDLPSHAELRLGQPFPDPSDFDLVVPSPGVPPARYRNGARKVWGDIELAARALRVPIVAITGTNGKSTTTKLVEAMLRMAGLRARAGGNVGQPALDLVGEALDVAVLEVSSFQLETVESFRPRVAVVLNLSPDHLDRHGGLEGYLAAKAAILARQTPDDVAVLCADDARVRELATETRARLLWFSLARPGVGDAWWDSGAVVLRGAGIPRRFVVEGPFLANAANRINALAAFLAITAVGADPTAAAKALPEFPGLPHRSQVVARSGNVTWIDDSKATNPGAAAMALANAGAPVIWIAGGKDKELDFDELARDAARHIRAAVLFGESAPKLARALEGRVPVHRAEDLSAAVLEAGGLAQSGDVVLLAPACASFDQFGSFVERGERFQTSVRAYLDSKGRP